MVEKIIINPNKVRGYGNIVSSKGASDFITYAGSITEGTDTVYGATEKIFTLEDTTLLIDGGTTNNHNDIWGNMDIFTRGSDGTSVYYQNTGSSALQRWLASRINITGDAAIDFELVDCTSCRFNIARYKTGSTTTYESRTFTQTGLVHIEIKSTGTYFYFNGSLVQSNTNNTNLEQISLAVYVGANTTANAKYKNLRIYYL